MHDGKLRIGCAGLGPRGRHLLTNVLYIKDAEVSAICDINEEALNSCALHLKSMGCKGDIARFLNFTEMLDSGIDAVIIATEVSLHTIMSIEALKKGKHVLSEVPAINTLEEAVDLYQAAVQSGRKFMMGENCCFWAFINTWKSMYQDGLIGDIWYAEAEYLHSHGYLMKPDEKPDTTTWRSRLHAIQYLTHDLGPLLYLLNDRCVSASGFAPGNDFSSRHTTGTPSEVGMFMTEKGTLIKVLTSFSYNLIRHPERHNFCIYGSKGTVETTRDGEYAVKAYLKDVPNATGPLSIPVGVSYPDMPEHLRAFHGGADFLMLESFVKCIVNDTPPPVDVKLAVNMSLPGLYAHMSKEKGGIPLEIPDIEELCKTLNCVGKD